ncbi:alpha/beta fold hydrolase [Marinobacter sp.]|uniref:alpha/beta fold hydrolase n=1 Tax=Marinobacter sp. TaxID=50741 RepID=UPI003569C4A8
MNQRQNQDTLILLPGMVCDQASWAPVLGQLEKSVETQIADYGDQASLTGMAEAVLASAPPQFSLAGHSMGGRVAMEICRLAPERVQRLCLIATEHTPKPEGEAGIQETNARLGMLELARSRGMTAMAEAWSPNLLAEENRGNQALVDEMVRMIGRQPVERLEAHITAGETRPDSTDVLRSLGCPVMLIAGKEDALRPASVMAQMQSLIAHCHFEIIPSCGHMPMMEQPDSVGSLLQNWLTAEINPSENHTDEPA